jgi:hypothetical protein
MNEILKDGGLRGFVLFRGFIVTAVLSKKRSGGFARH